jgi:hypothetical protein
MPGVRGETLPTSSSGHTRQRKIPARWSSTFGQSSKQGYRRVLSDPEWFDGRGRAEDFHNNHNRGPGYAKAVYWADTLRSNGPLLLS